MENTKINQREKVIEINKIIDDYNDKLQDNTIMINNYKFGKKIAVLSFMLISILYSMFLDAPTTFWSITIPDMIYLIITTGCLFKYFDLDNKIEVTSIDIEIIYKSLINMNWEHGFESAKLKHEISVSR